MKFEVAGCGERKVTGTAMISTIQLLLIARHHFRLAVHSIICLLCVYLKTMKNKETNKQNCKELLKTNKVSD